MTRVLDFLQGKGKACAAWCRESRRWDGGLAFPRVLNGPLPGFRGSLLRLQGASPSKQAGRAEGAGLSWGALETEIFLEEGPWYSAARPGPAVALSHAGDKVTSSSFNLVSDPAAARLSSGLTFGADTLESGWGLLVHAWNQVKEQMTWHTGRCGHSVQGTLARP